ncbi:MAG: hypothetical protein Q9163_006142 [Psora crenata]
MEFVDYGNAEIRVAFKTNEDGHWSRLGTDCLAFLNQNEETMNLDPDDLNTDTRFKAVILHEFGHALGCIHEHQSPAAGIRWNREFTIASYKQIGWTKKMVEEQVFKRAERSTTQFSAFDRWSIMLYPIMPGEAYNIVQDWNNELSTTDKNYIKKIYGKDSEGSGSTEDGGSSIDDGGAITGGEDVNKRDREGRTLLHLACKDNHLNRVKSLLKQGSDIEAKEWTFGYTPLHMAVWYRHDQVVLLLLLNGASKSARTKAGHTPLKLAQMWKHRAIINLLSRN